MTRELAEIIEGFVAGEARSHRPEDRALIQKYLAALGPILAASVSGKAADAELDAFQHLLDLSWLVDVEPFRDALSKWHALRGARATPATPNESAVAHLSAMVDLVGRAGGIPAEVREHSHSYDSFGSWSVVLRCKGHVMRVLWNGKAAEWLVERAQSRKPPYEWQGVVSWVSTTGDAPGPEVFEAIERVAG